MEFSTFTDSDLAAAIANAKFLADLYRKDADSARIKAMTAQVTLDAANAEQLRRGIAAREGGAK